MGAIISIQSINNISPFYFPDLRVFSMRFSLTSLLLFCSLLGAISGALAHSNSEVSTDVDSDSEELSPLARRLFSERSQRNNPYVITPHKPNYILPISYHSHPNEQPLRDLVGDEDADFNHFEMEFQLSIRVPLWDDVFGTGVNVSAAYTAKSFWQAYNSEISAPFRETNYEPELLIAIPNGRKIFGFTNVANIIGFNHQSNGRSGSLSRSWNRVTFASIFEKDKFAMQIKPWYRLPEDFEEDDNPGIDRYLGNFEWLGAYKWENHTMSLMWRNNLRSDHNRGAAELAWSFPINKRLKGYFKYFNGYGMSLIDYDHNSESIGLGLLLSDWF